MPVVAESTATILERVFVLGGTLFVSERPCEYVTILGSCVSVCLWDRKTGVGGINHFLMPETVNNATSLNGGISSTRKLVQLMTLKSFNIKNLEAKVFGGANRFFEEGSFLHVGMENVRAALFVLEEAGIPIAVSDTGGELGRKIYFNTQTGKVRMEKINYR